MDPLDQVHVVRHDLQVVCFVDLTLCLQALLQRVHRVFQELLLVLVLILDALIDLTVFFLLVLDKVEQALVHCFFQPLVIVGVVYDLVDSIFEVVDDRIIVAQDVPVSLDVLLD